MISRELEDVLCGAFQSAHEKRHEFVTVEHLLLALLGDGTVLEALKAVLCDIDKLREKLTDFIARNTPIATGVDDVVPQPTLGFQRSIQRGVMYVEGPVHTGKKELTGAIVLNSIFGEKDSHARYFLEEQGVTRFDLTQYVTHGIRKVANDIPIPEKQTRTNVDWRDDGDIPTTIPSARLAEEGTEQHFPPRHPDAD